MAKRSKAGSLDVSGAVDRLSSLPDGLIHTVMSFLLGPEVMRTCVLSRRWRSLWRSVPRINIDEQDFGISLMMIGRDDALEEKWASFEDFATNLLLFHDNTSSLGEFWLSSRVYNHRHVDRWIRRGIEYCPSVLDIVILRYPRFKLPPVVGSNFCHLKMLCLQNVDLGSHFADLLCSACPVMEDLKLKNCEFSGNSSQAITSSALKMLELVSCVYNTGYPLLITAPSLEYLFLCDGCYEADISLCKMDSLVEAKFFRNYTPPQKIHHELLGSLFNVTRLELLGSLFNVTRLELLGSLFNVTRLELLGSLFNVTRLELLGSLFNVTRLELRGFQAEAMLLEKSDRFPIFRNMQTLDLGYCFLDKGELKEKLEVLGSFIQNAHCLEKLTLNNCMFQSFLDSEQDIGRKNITLKCLDRKTFQCHKLKLIKVFYEHDDDHRLVELVWSLGRSFPDVNIEVTKEDE